MLRQLGLMPVPGPAAGEAHGPIGRQDRPSRVPLGAVHWSRVMPSTDDHRRLRFWQPDCPSVTGMFRLEREDRIRVMYTEQFMVIAVYEGAFDGWYRGAVRTHVAGAIKLKEPGEIHRDLRVHAPFTLQGVGFSQETVAAAAAARGLRGPLRFRGSGFGPR
jgi:hypothetical protein